MSCIVLMILQPSQVCRLCRCMHRDRDVTSHIVFGDVVHGVPHGIVLRQASVIQAAELILQMWGKHSVRQMSCLRFHRPLLITEMPAKKFCVIYKAGGSFAHT